MLISFDLIINITLILEAIELEDIKTKNQKRIEKKRYYETFF